MPAPASTGMQARKTDVVRTASSVILERWLATESVDEWGGDGVSTRLFGRIAQLAEQRTLNPFVESSILSAPTTVMEGRLAAARVPPNLPRSAWRSHAALACSKKVILSKAG